MLHKSVFRAADAVSVSFPNVYSLRGRFGAVRTKRGTSLDATFVSMYAPPAGTGQDSEAAKLLDYAAKFMYGLPSRTWSIVGMDANCRLGCAEAGDVDAVRVSSAVGLCEPDAEGDRGAQFRRFLEAQHLVAVNTFFPAGRTYYSALQASSSRIDFLVLPRGLLNQVRTCVVDHQIGDQLQLIPSVYRADHRPLVVTVGLELGFGGLQRQQQQGQPQKQQWRQEAISRMVITAEGRAFFLQAVEGALEEDPELMECRHGLDDHWRRLQQTVVAASAEQFAVGGGARERTEAQQQQAQALAERRRLIDGVQRRARDRGARLQGEARMRHLFT